MVHGRNHLKSNAPSKLKQNEVQLETLQVFNGSLERHAPSSVQWKTVAFKQVPACFFRSVRDDYNPTHAVLLHGP